MVKRYKVPLRPGDKNRQEFIAQLSDNDLSDIDITPNKRQVSMKEQIEADREVHLEVQQDELPQGQVLHPADQFADIPIGDDELAPEEPPKTEEGLAREMADENLAASRGRGNFAKNPAGAGQAADTEFEGDVANITPVLPPGMGAQ